MKWPSPSATQRRRLLFLVGVVLGVAIVVALPQIVAAVASFLSNSGPVQGGVTLHAPNGPAVNMTESADVNLTDPFDNGEVRIRSSAGNITVRSNGRTNATVTQINGTWTNVTAIDTNGREIQFAPGDKQWVNASGDIDALAFQAVVPEDDASDFVYEGASGTSTVTVSGLSAGTQYGAIDRNTGDVLDVATADASGVVTWTLPNSKHVVEVETGDSPIVDNSSVSPTGDLTTITPTLSIDISDPDFDPGDNVTVNWSVDGSRVATTHTQQNGTVSYTVSSPLNGGDHTWSVTAEDAYGNVVQSDTFDIRVPANLSIRAEQPPHDIITSGTATVRFFEDRQDSPTIVERSTSNGKLNLTGLPTGTQFVAVVSAPGYHNRTVIIDSLFDQQTVFLLNKSADTVQNRFLVQDRTGNFPNEETELVIEKAINRSLYDSSANGFEWTNIAGDDLGADEAFVTDLERESRYRLRVQNEDGDVRILGAHTPETTGTIDLGIGSVVVDPSDYEGVGWGVNRTNQTGDPVRVHFMYNDSQGSTSRIWLRMYEYGNESNVLLANTSFDGPYGTFSYSQDVPAAENNTDWAVEFVAVRDGENIVATELIGTREDLVESLPTWLATLISIGVIWLVAGLFSRLNGAVGGIVVAGLGAMFFYAGIMPPAVGGGVVVLSLVTAGILFINEQRGGLAA